MECCSCQGLSEPSLRGYYFTTVEIKVDLQKTLIIMQIVLSIGMNGNSVWCRNTPPFHGKASFASICEFISISQSYKCVLSGFSFKPVVTSYRCPLLIDEVNKTFDMCSLYICMSHDFTCFLKLSFNTIVSLNFHNTPTFLLNRLGIESSFIQPIFVKCLVCIRNYSGG